MGVTCDGLGARPRVIKDSHPLNTTETKGKFPLHGPTRKGFSFSNPPPSSPSRSISAINFQPEIRVQNLDFTPIVIQPLQRRAVQKHEEQCLGRNISLNSSAIVYICLDFFLSLSDFCSNVLIFRPFIFCRIQLITLNLEVNSLSVHREPKLNLCDI